MHYSINNNIIIITGIIALLQKAHDSFTVTLEVERAYHNRIITS